MHRVETITDLEDPRLAPFRKMTAQDDHLGREIFIAEDPKVVRRFLASHHEVISVVVSPRWQPEFMTLIADRPDPLTLLVVDQQVLEQITGYKMYQGVMALGRIPAPISNEELLNPPNRPAGAQPRLVLVADGVTNAENVGSLIRNGIALGVDTFVSGENSAHPYLRRSVRASMGNIFRLPYFRSTNLVETIRQMEAHGIACLAAVPRPTAITLWQTDFVRDIGVVIGAEGPGLRAEVIEACSACVSIPMQSGVDSLNVGSATAVLLAESVRQRQVAEK